MLRLRLSQTEVARLAGGGHVEESITFPSGRKLTYTVACGNSSAIAANFEGEQISVLLPELAAKDWIESDRPGIESICKSLRVLVEKDFQCLHRPGEEEPDSFPNPLAEKT